MKIRKMHSMVIARYNFLIIVTGFFPVISKIEKALLDRLKRGLGNLASTVKSYGGELDDDGIGTSRLPLVMVTYGGSQVERRTVNRQCYKSTATFVVIVVTQSLRSEIARRGGVDKREIGAYQLVSAVRRLLDSQTLGQLVYPLNPKAIRTMWNNAKVGSSRLTAYSIEYAVEFDDLPPLADGAYPEETADENAIDYIFNAYHGQLSPPDGELASVTGKIYDPNSTAEVPILVTTRNENEK